MARVDTEIRLDDGALEALARARGQGLTNSVADRTANLARALAPVGRTGDLKRSIRHRVRRTINGYTAEVYSTAPYAIYVHEGTRPHRIEPKPPRKALRFEVGGGPVVVFARGVNHPGTKAQPFLRDALDRVAPREGFSPRPV